MTKLHKIGILGSFDYESFNTCELCLLGKMTKLPFRGNGERVDGPLDLIHFIYFITSIDDYSQYGYLYLMRYKSLKSSKNSEMR